MFCPNCGKEIADGAPVCPECGEHTGTEIDAQPMTAQKPGEPVPEAGSADADDAQAPAEAAGSASGQDTAKAKQEKKKMPKRLLVILVAAVLLCVIVAVSAVVLKSSLSKNFGKFSENTVFSHSTYADAGRADGKTLIVPEQSPDNIITLDGTLKRSFWNLDCSVNGIVLGEDNVLYQIANGKEAFIEENVAAVSYSANGKGLAFTTGDYQFDNTERSDLYLRNGTRNERISRDLVGEPVFSPSGKYLLYTEYDGKNFKLLLHNGKKAKEIQSSKRRIAALGIRDDGKRMYYAVKDANGDELPGDYTLYHYDGETFEELGGFSFGNRILFNRDLSQILFVNDKNVWFSENGQDPVKLRMGGDDLLLITPYLASVQYGDSTLEPDLYDVKDFRNTFVLSDDTLYRFTGAEFQAVSRKVLGASVLNDEKTLLIRKTDGGLYRMNGLKENAKEEELTTDGIDMYGMSANGKLVYYITKNAELYVINKKKAPVLISGENGIDAYVDEGTGRISHAGQITYREKNSRLYFVQEGNLYAYTAGEEAAAAPEYGMEGSVTSVTCFHDLVEVTTVDQDGVSRAYLSKDGETFTLLDEGYLPE